MIYLDPEQRTIVQTILKKFVPNAQVFIFGSRATGIRLKKFSDLDVLIDAQNPVSLKTRAELREAFSESDLPFRVDIADVQSTDKRFLDAIQKDLVLIQE